MTKYLQNFLAVISIVKIACNKNLCFCFSGSNIFRLVERTSFEVSSSFVNKVFLHVYTDPVVCSGVTSRSAARGGAKARVSIGP